MVVVPPFEASKCDASALAKRSCIDRNFSLTRRAVA
jgi:hypothetical protein